MNSIHCLHFAVPASWFSESFISFFCYFMRNEMMKVWFQMLLHNIFLYILHIVVWGFGPVTKYRITNCSFWSDKKFIISIKNWLNICYSLLYLTWNELHFQCMCHHFGIHHFDMGPFQIGNFCHCNLKLKNLLLLKI